MQLQPNHLRKILMPGLKGGFDSDENPVEYIICAVSWNTGVCTKVAYLDVRC